MVAMSCGKGFLSEISCLEKKTFDHELHRDDKIFMRKRSSRSSPFSWDGFWKNKENTLVEKMKF